MRAARNGFYFGAANCYSITDFAKRASEQADGQTDELSHSIRAISFVLKSLRRPI